MRVFLETMGCQMNQLDSELVLGRLRAAGHEVVADAESADVVLYNTCSVRRRAEQKACSRLGQQGKRKRLKHKDLIVGVLGCMAQRRGQGLLDAFPGVDIVCGPGQIDRVPDMIAEVSRRRNRLLAVTPPRQGRSPEVDERASRRLEQLDLSRPAGPAMVGRAFVRAQRGCDNFCSYCIVPYVRGSQQSRDPAKILQEVERLAGAGCKETILLGQTVSSYCFRDGGRTTRLGDLLGMLQTATGIERIRFVTSYPAGFDRAILRAMRDLPKVCEYLHIPAQSGSDRMLRAMNRRYTVSEYLDLIAEARDTVANLAVAGDFIVGFPGENEEDFQASCRLIRAAEYTNSFIFKYSPRDGTAAAGMADDVGEQVKRRRNNDLLAVQNELCLAHNQALVGTVQRVLAEGPSPRAGKQPTAPPAGEIQLQGRTRGNHVVVFDAPADLVGQFVDVRITSATALALVGRRVPEV